MIKIDHATFTYGENNEYSVGIRDIDLEIEDGQVIVLCGESGCGKTTLTRMINGLIPHYYEGKLTGEIWINGIKDLSRWRNLCLHGRVVIRRTGKSVPL